MKGKQRITAHNTLNSWFMQHRVTSREQEQVHGLVRVKLQGDGRVSIEKVTFSCSLREMPAMSRASCLSVDTWILQKSLYLPLSLLELAWLVMCSSWRSILAALRYGVRFVSGWMTRENYHHWLLPADGHAGHGVVAARPAVSLA